MTTLHIYSNRHIGEQVSNIKKGDWIYLENSLSKNRWLLFFKYKNIDESNLDVTYITQDQLFELRGSDMKFDSIVGNPPYQMVTNGNSNPIWHNFVIKSFELLKDGGYLSMVHPAGWRNVSGKFTNVRDLLLSKQLEYLEIHNIENGQKTFGASTRYDWYTMQNVDRYKNTIVKFEDGIIEEIDLRKLPFIPNHSYNRIESLIAKEGDARVDILHSESAYELRKKYVSKKQTDEFKYPLISRVRVGLDFDEYWSSRNDLGHFGISKLVFSVEGATGAYVDIDGVYGLTQFAWAIVDDVENLIQIKKVFDSSVFRELMTATTLKGNVFNYKIIATFRKDFWKEFV
jgi:hypothetical protein